MFWVVCGVLWCGVSKKKVAKRSELLLGPRTAFGRTLQKSAVSGTCWSLSEHCLIFQEIVFLGEILINIENSPTMFYFFGLF